MSFPLRCALTLLILSPALVAAERPSLAEIRAKLTVHITAAKQVGDQLKLHWDQPNQPPSDGIKVVLSTSHEQPVHGRGLDTYVHWIPGTGHTATAIPLRRIHELTGGQPCWLRLVFVHREDHEDPAKHVAYSSVIQLAMGDGHRPPPRLGAERPRREGPLAERMRQRLQQPVAPAHEPVAAAPAQTSAAPVQLPPPAELVQGDLSPAEREVVEAIYELEQRKLALEQRLAAAER